MKVAFLGLGIMGSRMSERLIRAGFDLTVWNRTSGRAEGLKALGAKEAPSPKEGVAELALPVTSLVNRLFAKAEALGLGEEAYAALIKLLV